MAKVRDIQLDEAIKNGTTDELPPLHGIPFSIKDLIEVKGARSTVGCDFLANYKAKENSPTVQIFIDAGGIPLVKGNVPQLAYSLHSENRIFGCSLNFYDKTRSCGGSSGGEGGIIASKCAPLALGNDIGGSIRVPCAFNGIRGLKPTPERVSFLGDKNALVNGFIPRYVIKSSIGPMGRSV